MTRWRRTTRLAAAVATVLALIAGCGSQDAPSDAVPSLSARLEDIDGAIVDGRFAVAREQLGALGEDTATALEDGDLGEDQARRILDAVRALLEALPPQEPTQEPTREPTAEDPTDVPTDEPTTEPTDDESSDGEAEVEVEEPDDEDTSQGKPPKGSKGPKGKGQKGR